MQKRRTWTALALAAALILCVAAPTSCAAEDARMILMVCSQQGAAGERAEVVFLDEDGNVWRVQSDEPLPETDEKRLAFLADCRDATLVRQLNANRVLELKSLIAAAGEPQMMEQSVGARDCGLAAYSAVRYGADGAAECIPLAVAGDRVVENLEPNAYALYVACFTEVMGYDVDAAFDSPVKPQNIRRVPLATFLGIDADALANATLTASRLDCEAGYIDMALDDEEAREKLSWLSGLVVTGKRNALCVTGDTVVYTLRSAEGVFLAKAEFYQGLLVKNDGMYTVKSGL